MDELRNLAYRDYWHDPQRYGGSCHITADAAAKLLSFFVFLR
jgi:hypothetical protein